MILKRSSRPTLAGFSRHDVMRQPMQRADTIFVQGLERILEKALDPRFEVVHCGIDQRDNQHFLVISKRAAVDDLGASEERI